MTTKSKSHTATTNAKTELAKKATENGRFDRKEVKTDQKTEAKTEAQAEPQAETQKEPENAEPVKTVDTVFTAEQRRRSLKQLNLMDAKLIWLQNKQDELNSFEISNEGTKESIVLSNASGFKFEVHNTMIIQQVLELLRNQVETKISETQKEIATFVF